MRSPLELRQVDGISHIGHGDRDPVVVVGSGLAGLLVAVRGAHAGPVILVTRTELGDGNTGYAQGGIAAAVGPADRVDAHLQDTLVAGAGLCDPGIVAAAVAAGPPSIAILQALGVPFDRDHGRLALGREGAHSADRIVHAGGDATGARVVDALRHAVRNDPRIIVREHTRVLEVLVRDGQVRAVLVEDAEGGLASIGAHAVVLATGGAGHLFSRTTNPATATGDGVALAVQAGAAVADLEMVQFHPTALAVGGSPLPLISEAVRGAGAYLRAPDGRRFMRDEHPLAELGPRDVVARAVARTALAEGGEVTLDLRHLDPDRVHRRFPTVSAVCADAGLDLARDPVPVTPAAHYAIGGVLADLRGRTTLVGLYAIGECAATGLHGANRLASNSLLEAAVMAVQCADDLADGDPAWAAADPARMPDPPDAARPTGDDRPVGELMWAHMGLERDADGMAHAAATLDGRPDAESADDHALLTLARLSLMAARHRDESRGAHFRRDVPATRPEWAVRVAWLGGEPLTVASASHTNRERHRAKEAA
jgi:L-aspartate oxidase